MISVPFEVGEKIFHFAEKTDLSLIYEVGQYEDFDSRYNAHILFYECMLEFYETTGRLEFMEWEAKIIGERMILALAAQLGQRQVLPPWV